MKYIDRQAKIASDPLFDNIPDSRPTTSGKAEQKDKYSARKEIHGSSFAINVSAENKGPEEIYAKPATSSKAVSAYEKL